MSSLPLQIYHALPPPLRSAAASLRGYCLRSWRYGPETERLVAEALERETWSRERWRSWQQEQLSRLLHRAATKVPYYRQIWEERRRRGDRSSWERLESWPILEKEAVRTNPLAFVADDCNVRRMYHEHTSGTTGKPLDLWWSREMVRAWYALFEARWRRWYGVSRHDRWAILGGQLVAPVARRHPPFWVWNAALNQLYMSAYHLSPALLPHYLDALKRYRIRYLWGYTSALFALAQEALRWGRSTDGAPSGAAMSVPLRMEVVIANAEPVYGYQREAVEQAFGCPLRETYGMAEAVAAASECAHGRMHLWPEAGGIEVVQGETPVPNGMAGELIGTGLLNTDMPLIRYCVGDRGALASPETGCPCGRTLPILKAVEGRTDDVLYTPDGRQIGRLDPVFKANLPVREAQIIQEALRRVRVRYVPAPGFTDADGKSIVERLRERMGDVAVVLEAVSEIPRTSSGKFQAVICQIPPEQRSKLVNWTID
jgi:phenylacetate-CoA ligase